MPKTPLRAISLFALIFFCSMAYGNDMALWNRYKADFLTDDGRIVDHHQGQLSHSEGQGYGMRLAVIYDDRETFDRIWLWTRNNLGLRADNLFVWQWGKRIDGRWAVLDYNNATDGDIIIAYALLKAEEKWHDGSYKADALKIIRDIRENLSVKRQGRTLLLPGYYGFFRENTLVLNPSYMILPAFRYFAQADDGEFWGNVHSDSIFVLEQSCFGRLCLPSDWVSLTDSGISLFMGKDPYFGKDAVRTFLYLTSGENPRYPKGAENMLHLYRQKGYIPLWVDLVKDSISMQEAPAGFYAVYALLAKKTGDSALSSAIFKEAAEKLKKEKKDYYSFTLYLLSSGGEIF